MTGSGDQGPIDLARYRKAAQAQAEARRRAAGRPQAPAAGGPEPFLGRRRHAGLILALAAVVFLALGLAPLLH